MKTLRQHLLVCCWVGFHAAAIAAETTPPAAGALEGEVTRAMVSVYDDLRDGMVYQDYVRRLPALTALYERYQRSGGNNPELQLVYDRFLEARSAWERLVDARNRRTPEGQATPEIRAAERAREKAEETAIQQAWKDVVRRLDTVRQGN